VSPPDEVELLEDERDVAPCHPELAPGDAADIASMDEDLARIRPGEAGEASEQRRLAGPARAEHRDELPRPHVEGYAAEGLHAVRVAFDHPFHADHGGRARKKRR